MTQQDPTSKMTDFVSRDRLISIKREFLKRTGKPGRVPSFVVNKLCSALDKELTHQGRNDFLSWLTGRTVTTSKIGIEGGLDQWDGFKLCMWARPVYKRLCPDHYADTFFWDMLVIESVFKPKFCGCKLPGLDANDPSICPTCKMPHKEVVNVN